MKDILSFSYGLSSAIMVDRVLLRYPNAEVVFMDTLIEDDDNYRFGNDCIKRWGIKVKVLTEGRTPYEVSHSENVIPNSRVAPCTKRLKIDVFKKYLKTQEKPITIHIGYDFTEMHRIEATKSNYESLGYSVDFPLLWKPYEFRKYTQVVKEDWNIEPPRMYDMGYTHANCGGTCVKQGQGDWLRTLINFPDRYARAEEWEAEMQKHSDVHARYAILKTQTLDGVIPLTLKELRERFENKPVDFFKLDAASRCVACGIGDLL